MARKTNAIVRVATREANLKRRLRRHLTSLGFQKTKDGELAAPGTGKDAIRAVHAGQREDRLAANRPFLSGQFLNLVKYVASGNEIDPSVSRLVACRLLRQTAGDRAALAAKRLRRGKSLKPAR